MSKETRTKKTAKKTRQREAGPVDVALGKKIRLRRIEMGQSQEQLGAALNVSFQQVQKYEKGVNRVSHGRLMEIAKALETPVDFFYESTKGGREVESLLFLDSAFSLRLLKAYNTVEDQTVQRQFVALIESVAAVVANR